MHQSRQTNVMFSFHWRCVCLYSSWPMWPWGFDWRHHFCCKLPGFHPAAVRSDAHEERTHAASPGGHDSRPGEKHTVIYRSETPALVSSGVPIIRSFIFFRSFWNVLKHVHTKARFAQCIYNKQILVSSELSEVTKEKHAINIHHTHVSKQNWVTSSWFWESDLVSGAVDVILIRAERLIAFLTNRNARDSLPWHPTHPDPLRPYHPILLQQGGPITSKPIMLCLRPPPCPFMFARFRWSFSVFICPCRADSPETRQNQK